MPASLLAITLSTLPGPFRVGEAVPVRIEVRNVSGRPLSIVGVLDGSETGFRYPRWEPRITGPEPLPPPEGTPWCGNVAPLLRADFRELEPDEGVDPTEAAQGAGWLPIATFRDFRPPAPGSYRFLLTLDTDSGQDEEWLGIVGYPGEDEVLKRLSRVPRLRVESNMLTIDVT